MIRGSKSTLALSAHYGLIQALYWMGYAGLQGFSSVYLLGEGFSNTQIGLLTAAGFSLSALLQPALAAYADRPSSLSVKQLLIWTDLITLGDIALLLWARGNMGLTALIYGLGITFVMVQTPLVNALATESINRGRNLNFGAGRGCGSLGFALASLVMGWLEAMGTIRVPVFSILVFLLLLGFTLVFPFPAREAGQKTEAVSASSGGFFRRYPGFALVILGCVLLYTSHSHLGSYTFQIAESKGGGSPEQGVIMALAAFAELPTMFFFASFRGKKSGAFWMLLGGTFMTVKALGTLAAPAVQALYPVQLSQMLGYALLAVATVFYTNGRMAPGDAVKGQAMLTTAFTLGKVLGGLSGGALIDRFGVSAMVAAAAVSAALGTALLFLGLRKKQV